MKRLAALAWWMAAGVASADDSRSQVDQRIQLATRLIADSATAQRLATADHPQARSHFEESRVHLALAQDALNQNDLEAARRAVNEALRHIGTARRLLPDPPARLEALRQRQEQRRVALERLIEAWRSRAQAEGRATPTMLDAVGRLDAATGLGQQGRFEEASQALSAAESVVLTAMGAMFQSREIDYTARAASPAEEWQLELARHRSLAELVPLALSDLKPRADAAALVERYQDTSRALHAQAVQRQQAGDTEQALSHIRNATLYLQRALNAAGLSSPTPTGE